MRMEITFPSGARVDASFGPFTVRTDQPRKQGGEGSAPSPFALFLASIGTCAGIYVLGFLRQRGLDAADVRLIQQVHADDNTGMISRIDLQIEVPPDFPEKYHAALIKAAELCLVKKHLEHPPDFDIRVQKMSVASA